MDKKITLGRNVWHIMLYFNIYLFFQLEKVLSLHMHAKPSFAHRLQTAKMASSRTSAQNNDPRAQNNRPWVKRVLLERKMW